MRFLIRASLLASLCLPMPALAAPLPLEDALRRALEASPQNAVARTKAESLAKARQVAGARPAGTIVLEGENFAFKDKTFEDTEFTLVYEHTIERGGKRTARIAAADREIGVADAEAMVARLDVLAEAQKLYVEAQAATLKRDAAAEHLKLVESLGAAPDVRKTAEDDLAAAERLRARSLRRLTSLWGGETGGAEVTVENFLAAGADRPAAAIAQPDLALYEARMAQANALVDLERAQAASDPTLFAGPRLFAGSGDVALVAGVSLPLARQRTNRASIERAEAERRNAEALAAVERFQRQRELDAAVDELADARDEADRIRTEEIPSLERALAEKQAGHARRRAPVAEVLASAQSLAEGRSRMIDAAAALHTAQANLDRLTGRHAALAASQLPGTQP